MESNYQPQTDIASILQTLRAYAPSQQQPLETTYQSQPFQATNQPQAPPQPPDLEEGEYDPSAYDPSLPLITTPHPQASHLQAPNTQSQKPPPTTYTPPVPKPIPTSHPQSPPEPTPTSLTPAPQKPHPPPPYHPSTITTWPPALRHITNQTTTDPAFLPRIRHLIKSQHTHERQWWTGRSELASRLLRRSEGRQKLDRVLGSLGGHTTSSTSSSNRDELSEAQELGLYDRKVHRACGEMAAATGKELGRMEVPFFCTAAGLVSERGDGKAQGKRRGTVSEKELGVLRGRMVGLLEDLCGEE